MAMNSAMDTTELLGGFEQVDIFRPWQSLVGKVKDVVSAVTRDVLLSVDTVPDGGVLLKLWNSFLISHSRCLNEDRSSGISSDVMNKLESLLILLQRFNSKLNTLSPSEFSELITEFQHFKLQRSQSLDCQSHGTFEWVDGMLVQALNSGDWLLLDNVNFCSPSVLDRLNALLEPGGVLTISERGVIDGTSPTIVPHPNFRLFMTMDPAHGEISRAMRNRGIEIYVAGEHNADSLDKQDIKTLLHGLGFVGDHPCTELMALCSEVKEIIAGGTSSISSLLHAAVLIVQQLKHSVNLAEAFHRACSEVFVLSQTSRAHQEQVQELVEKHKLTLMSPESWGDSLVSLGLWPDSIPSAVFTVEESMLSMVHRDGQVLAYCLNQLSLRNNRSRPLTLTDLELVLQSCNMDSLLFYGHKTAAQITELSMVPAVIRLVTEKASNQDWLLRARWLCHTAKTHRQLPELVCAQLEAGAKALNVVYSSVLPAGMKEVIQQLQLDANESTSIPLDPRWNQQHFDILLNSMAYSGLRCSKELQVQLCSIANRMALLMDREERGYMEKMLLSSDAAKKSGRRSALRVSIAFQKGMVNFDDLPHPVLAHLAAFFEAWDACVVQCIKSPFSNLEDDVFHEVQCNTLWRDRFWIVSDRVTTDPEGIALLSLHWHWVMKHLLKDHLSLLSDSSQVPQEIRTISLNLQSHLASPSGMTASVKGLQNSLGRPLPFKVGSVVECVSKLKVMSSALDVLKLRPRMTDVTWKEQLYRIKAAASDWNIKRHLMLAWGLVVQANHFAEYNTDMLQCVVDSQTSAMKSQGLLKTSDSQNLETGLPQLDEACLNQLATSTIQLWPVQEYLALLCKYKVVTDLLDLSLVSSARTKPDQSMMHAELRQLVTFCLRSTPMAARELRGFWYLAQADELSPEELKLLSSELMSTIFGAFWSSSVTTDPDYWLTWKPLASIGDDWVSETIIDKSLKGPGILCRDVQSKCFFEILTNTNRSTSGSVSGIGVMMVSHVTLGEWLERTQQLQEVSSVLWTNMAVGSFADFRFTDSRLQCTLLLKQLHAIKDLLPRELQEEYLQTCDQLAIDKNSIASHSIQSLLSNLAEQEVLPEDVVSLLVTSVRKFVGKEKDFRSLSAQARSGCLWVNLGLLQIQIWTPQTKFDPAVKKLYKLNYVKEELQQLQYEWKGRSMSEQLLTGRELLQDGVNRHCHPRIRFLQQRISHLKEQIAALSRKQAHRPDVPQYDYLYQEIHHYVNSVAQKSKVKSLLSHLLLLLQAKRPKPRQSIQVILDEEAAWQQSHHQFRRRIAEEYCQYPDVIEPLLAAILQMQHGMRLLASEVHLSLNNKLVKQADLTRLVTCLLAFPSISFSFPTYLAQAGELCSKASVETLKGLNQFLCKNSLDEKSLARKQQLLPTQEQLLMNALLYLRCHVLSLGELDQASLQLFRHICQAMVNAWNEQEECRRAKEEQEANLYKYKSKQHASGLAEAEEEEEFKQNFPQYTKDFSDITSQPSLEQEMDTEVESTVAKTADAASISQSSIQIIINIHQQICMGFVQTVWYRHTAPAHQCSDYLSAFVSSYHTAALLNTQFYSLIDASLSGQLHGGQLLISALIQNSVGGEETSELVLPQEDTFDFYQHPNIQEAKKCQPVLRNFTQKVKELLLDWPDHPALLQLLVVMDRIRSFPVSCALAKFLNGMEILLNKSQDWEENASRSVSLRQHLDAVSQLIIQWRKLELNCWSNGLNIVMKRHMEKSTKHWFSIYQLIEKYLQERTEENLQEMEEQMKLPAVIKTLQAFIEGATLGEFHFRLSMLLAFHCHVLTVPEQEGKDVMCSLLWNLYSYYKQFSECVQAKITELRHPIEKELKDFVKISRWNDASFWSIKQSVEKTHRTLFKFMKKFEAALNNPCCPALTEMGRAGSLDSVDQQKQTKMEKLNCVLRKVSSEKCHVTQVIFPDFGKGSASLEGSSLQSRLPALSKRMRKMCLKLMTTNSLPSFVESLDQFTGDVITAVQDLQALVVDQTADKDKQRSEVKHILMQKQRALADLFKHLTEIGLSYRKGLAWSKTEDPQNMLCLHPLDVKTAVNMVANSDELDNMLLAEVSAAWEGCHKFFYQSLARRAALQAAMHTPAKELSLGNVERCRGFTAHLLKLLIEQRQCLTGLTEQWVSLRHLIKSLEEIQKRLAGFKEHDVALPPQDGVKLWMAQLRTLSMKFIMALEQLLWFLQCCPRDKPSETNEVQDKTINTEQMGSSKESLRNAEMAATSLPEDFVLPHLRFPTPLVEDYLPSACKMRQGDPVWQQVTQQVVNMLKEVKAVKADVDKMSHQTSKTLLYSWACFETCSTGIGCLSRTMVQLQDVQAMFAAPASGNASYCPALFRSLEYIKEEVSCAMDEFTTWEKELLNLTFDDSNVSSLVDFSLQVEPAINTVLCAVQAVVKRQKEENGKEQEKITGNEGNENKEVVHKVQSGYLSKCLGQQLASDITSLSLQKVIAAVSDLLEKLIDYRQECTLEQYQLFNQSCRSVVRLLPMLTTYSELVLYYLTISMATHRSSGKLLSVLAHLFTDLAVQGFCLPKEFMEDAAGEGSTQFHDNESGGIGEGEGMKDVSDKIENEEQVEDTFCKDQKRKEDVEDMADVKEEENAIEMSEDFQGKLHDGDSKEPGEDDSDEESDREEEEELDKQMGDLEDAEADKLDERLWGGDDDEDSVSDEAEDTGPGMDMETSELVAKDDNMDATNQNESDKNRNEEKEEERGEEEGKEKIHEQLDEREYDENEVDPYQGNQHKQPEAEALDLPEDLNLESQDGEKSDEDQEEEGDNPFDIEEKLKDFHEKDPNPDEDETLEESAQTMEESAEPEQDQDSQTEQETDEKKQESESKEENLEEDQEHGKEETAEDMNQQQPKEDEQEESARENKRVPDDEGQQPKADEETEDDQEVPQSEQRMEHEAEGKTGEENLQSDTAVELAGSASERDQAKEEQGTGAADANQSEGHESKLMARVASQRQSRDKTQSFKRKPGRADNERTMGDRNECASKRLKMVEANSAAQPDTMQSEQKVKEADVYEHIKEGSDSYDAQTYDVATAEQQNPGGPEQEEETKEESESIEMESDQEEELQSVDVQELKPEKKSSSTKVPGSDNNLEGEFQLPKPEEMDAATDDWSESENEEISERRSESTIHTVHELLTEDIEQSIVPDPEELRKQLEEQLDAWRNQEAGNLEEEKASAEMWQQYQALTAPLSQQLCEQLRLILEPTQASKLRGDYRTGKRLNMRKVIPYIASQFRKDKIWLRRTKPSKRQYQICLAIDDSSSMVDNHSKQLAFESLAVIGNALSLLEVGQVAVCSFGENVQLLHPFHEQFNDQSGARILRSCQFQQKKTKIAQFLESAASMFVAAQHHSQQGKPETAQLLLIVSDGRGLFLEGKERVTAAVEAARHSNIFVIFVVLDNPDSKDSILDIKVPIFKDQGESPEIKSYMEEFPFPFYIILRNVNALPETLSDALRQWFELVTAADH